MKRTNQGQGHLHDQGHLLGHRGHIPRVRGHPDLARDLVHDPAPEARTRGKEVTLGPGQGNMVQGYW